MNHQWQTRNNCGPASVAILLGYYDHWVRQRAVKTWFWRMPGPCAVPWYVSRFALAARVYRFPLPSDRKVLAIRQLLANRIPVIVLQRLSLDSRIAHYRVIHGYDDAAGEFISDDPLLGPDHRLAYDIFVRLGGGTTCLFIPIYPPEKDDVVQSLMKEVGAYRWTNEEGLTCTDLERR